MKCILIVESSEEKKKAESLIADILDKLVDNNYVDEEVEFLENISVTAKGD